MKKENKDFENLEEFEEVSDTEQEEIDSYMDKEIEDYLKGKGKSGHKLRKTDENVVEEDVEDRFFLKEGETKGRGSSH